MIFPETRIDRAFKDRSAFTLIEVLVSTTILLVIVILVSMVFQGSNTAFQSGSRKIASQNLARNIIGMISHDLSMAVEDDTGLDFGIPNANNFNCKKITFKALTGTPKDSVSGTSSSSRTSRELQTITYEFRGNVVWRSVDGVNTCLNASTDGLDENGCGFRSLYFNDSGGMLANANRYSLPDCVEIRVSIDSQKDISFVSAWSYGKDGLPDTQDDIRVGLNLNE